MFVLHTFNNAKLIVSQYTKFYSGAPNSGNDIDFAVTPDDV